MQETISIISTFFMDNQNIIRIIYPIILIFLSLYIVRKTRHIYELCNHKGILIFSNAFLFLFIAFLFELLDSLLFLMNSVAMQQVARFAIIFVFYYFMTLGGFYIVRSLVWKDSAFNKDYIYFLVAAIIALMSMLFWYSLAILVQTILFVYAASIAYHNYINANEKNKHYRKTYFYALTLAAVAYLVNYIAFFIYRGNPIFELLSYLFTITVFITFANEVRRNLQWQKNVKDLK